MRQNAFHRISLMVFLALGCASCGFTPVYAPGSKTATELSDITIAPPKNDVASFIFVKELEDRIGRNLNGGKVLKHDIWIFEEGAGLIGADRIRVIGKVTYEVVSAKDGSSLFGGSVENFVGFSILNNITTFVRKDATERLMTILVDQLVTQLMMTVAAP